MEEQIIKLTKVMGALLNRIENLENSVATLKIELAAAKKQDNIERNKSHRKTLTTWRQIKELNAGGMAAKRIAELLQIPYSTVTSYLRTSEEDANKLPLGDDTAVGDESEGFVSKLEQHYNMGAE